MLRCRSSLLETGIPEVGTLELLSSDEGLAAILFCGERRSAATSRWLAREVGAADPAAAGEHETYERQIREYLAGSRTEFDFRLHRTGTAFRRAVLDAVGRVPYGATATYREIAAAVGSPKAVRAVGAANGANPLPLVIPCHRIVGSGSGKGRNGTENRMKLTGYGGGLDAKRRLLDLEASVRASAAAGEAAPARLPLAS